MSPSLRYGRIQLTVRCLFPFISIVTCIRQGPFLPTICWIDQSSKLTYKHEYHRSFPVRWLGFCSTSYTALMPKYELSCESMWGISERSRLALRFAIRALSDFRWHPCYCMCVKGNGEDTPLYPYIWSDSVKMWRRAHYTAPSSLFGWSPTLCQAYSFNVNKSYSLLFSDAHSSSPKWMANGLWMVKMVQNRLPLMSLIDHCLYRLILWT